MNVTMKMPEGLTPYEAMRWSEIQHWKSQAGVKAKIRLPQATKDALEVASTKIATGWEAVPGNDKVEKWVAEAVNGSFHMLIDGLSTTVVEKKILQRVSRHAPQPVVAYDDIFSIDLRYLDKSRPNQKLLRATVSAGHGAAAGFVAGGATAAGAASGGMAALPAAGLVAGAAVLDAAALVSNMVQSSALIGAYHGFDPKRPEEHAMLMRMLAAGLAKEGAKVAAMMKVRDLALMLAAKSTLAQLGQKQLFNLMKKLYAALLLKTAKRNIARGLPVIGIGLGAGVNYGAVRSMVETAEHLYPERFLIEKYADRASEDGEAHAEAAFEVEIEEADSSLVDRIVDMPAPEPDDKTDGGKSSDEDVAG